MPSAAESRRDEPTSRSPLTVFTVIPVFNRVHHTLACIELLKKQTYAPIEIIVSDGRSTDGTPAIVRREHTDVTVLSSDKELWWGGTMHAGMSYALSKSRCDGDFILMMNNDTEFDPDFIEALVRASREHDAAVGGLIVDSRDPSRARRTPPS